MKRGLGLRTLLTLCVALGWGIGVLGKSPVQRKNASFDEQNWTLMPADNVAVASLSDLKDGVYSIQLSGGRSGCGPSDRPEYLGFNNRTCSTKIDPRTTAGPVMRGPSDSILWREWTIRVVHQRVEKEDYRTVSLQAFIHPDVEQDARCLGFLSTFYDSPGFKGTCAIPPYGNALFLNASRDDSEDNSEMWNIRLADGATGEFEIFASNKPDACLRFLAAEDCSNQPGLIESSPPYFTDSTKYRFWKLSRRYDLVPKSSPPPPSPPSPSLPSLSPLPVGPAPGPVISAPSSSTSGYATVRVESVGGDSRCTVSSITLTSTGSALGSIPQTVQVSASAPGLSTVGVEVPLSQSGYNAVYAVGVCNNGGTTERSNGVSVFYSSSNGGSATPSPTPPPAWSIVGSAGFSPGQASSISLALDSANTPYVAYSNGASNGAAIVMKYNGIAWVNVGIPNFSAGAANDISLALDSTNTPYIAFGDGANNSSATVMTYNGTAWVYVGNAGFSAGASSFTSLALDSSNTPYVAFQDDVNSQKATVMAYNGTAWVDVGSPGFSAGKASTISLALDSANTPYVAYQDGGNSNKATVMKYNGTAWVDVGNAGFSAGVAKFTSLALDSANTPYVAYTDGANGFAATVMKYNGTAWVNVGSPGFSAGTASSTSLSLDSSNTPYVAYADGGNDDKATVMTYNGTDWVPVGNAGFTSGEAAYTRLALDSSNNPYVAYQDGDNDSKATVMTYQ